MSDARRRIVAVDSNVLINLIHLDRLDLLKSLPGYEFVVPDIVVAEITAKEQAQRLSKALDRGELRMEPVVELERDVFAELAQVMGKGEAACIAMAEMRGWLVATDEKRRVLRAARERLGEGKSLLERNRFKMKFGSFAELVESSR